MTVESWLTFVVIWTLAGLPLGPNAVHPIGVTLRNGYPRCFFAPLGMALACVIHATIASLGVGTLLLLSPTLFVTLKLAGAAYLAWLGVKLWLRKPQAINPQSGGAESAVRIVLSSCAVSLVNPKAVLSYVAIFAPFVSAESALLPQLVILIPTATLIVFLNYVGYALLAWPIRRWMDSAAKRRLFDRISGTMFIGFAALLGLSSRQSSV